MNKNYQLKDTLNQKILAYFECLDVKNLYVKIYFASYTGILNPENDTPILKNESEAGAYLVLNFTDRSADVKALYHEAFG